MGGSRRFQGALVVVGLLALGACDDDGTPGVDGGTMAGMDAASTNMDATTTMTDAGPAGTSSTVMGTITLPGDATGRCVLIAVDDDTTGANNTPRRLDGTYLLAAQVVNGTTITYAIPNVPAGNYFVWAFVDTDSSSSDPTGTCEPMGGPESGDYLGYYQTGLGAPGMANVTIPQAQGTTHDFSLGVFP